MYNRYLNTSCGGQIPEQPQELHTSPPPKPEPSPAGKPQGNILSTFGESLSGRLSSLHFDLDTVVVIIAIYFLIADSDDFDTDLLILIGILFFLGL